MQNRELREEMEETMGVLFDTLKGFIPNGQIPEGRNVDVECIRLTLDPIKSEHRPLAFYFVPPFYSYLSVGGIPPAKCYIIAIPVSWV
jgi:hypothetical protein